MAGIHEALPRLKAALGEGGGAVLVAPPGTGKTTLVPPALVEEPWMNGKKVLLLEPRRLAARAAAYRMAELLGEGDVGGVVGYRMRLETRVGPRTRIEVVTEGVLARMLRTDPGLEGVGLVIFDEFHERSLQADVGLALALHVRSLFRPDLRILVMSATLEGEPVASLLGGAEVVRAGGEPFRVETVWRDRPLDGWVEPAVAATVRAALQAHDGDVLAFLPGAAEIRRTEELLADALPPEVDVVALFGMLPREVQDRALRPSPPGRRKVVVASAIAESSLTIQGVRVVVDGGLQRVPRFNPGTGMTRLETVRVTRDAADQRRGRAGRTAPGVCYRLWTKGEEAGLVPARAPEIREADLAPLALDLAVFGADPAELRWLDPPAPPGLAHARELLGALGALGPDGAVTPHGRRMADVGIHPRLAHLVLRGAEMGAVAVACDLAALLEERDVLRSGGGGAGWTPPPVDLGLRLDALRGERRVVAPGFEVDRGVVARVRQQADALRRRLGASDAARGRTVARGEAPASGQERVGVLTVVTYPERLARLREGTRGRYLLRNGKGVVVDPSDPLAGEAWLAVAEVDGGGRDGRVITAAALTRDEVERIFGDEIRSVTEVAWDDAAGRVQARSVRRLGALTLAETGLAGPDPALVVGALCDGVRARGLGLLGWSRESRQLRERLDFLRALEGGPWPDVSDEGLLASLDEWLGPFLGGARSADDLARLDPGEAMLASLPWELRGALARLAPTHVEVPSGSRIAVDYADPGAPVLAVRLQEVFGLTETPRVAGGKVPLTLHLLSPAHRPVQVTRDLASFWKGAYFDVRKDLRARYPKHPWPEDPLTATPTRRAKPRKER